MTKTLREKYFENEIAPVEKARLETLITHICGKWAPAGTKISGVWVSGASDPDDNGFRFE